jgi:hypothetical protein
MNRDSSVNLVVAYGPGDWGSIRLRKVFFSPPDSDRLVVHPFSYAAPPLEATLQVGEVDH